MMCLDEKKETEITNKFNMEIDDAVNYVFRHYQRIYQIEDGAEPFDTRIRELQEELAKECTRVLEFQIPSYEDKFERECIIDYMDVENEETDLSNVIDKLSELFGFNNKSPIIAQIISYRAGTWHEPYYEMTDDLYEWLNEYIQCVDCKNGTQIYKDKNGYYFCITGSCWTNTETGISGTDEIHLKFKNFEW